MSELTPQQQYDIAQVAATMELEDMPLDEQTYNYLVQLATKHIAMRIPLYLKTNWISMIKASFSPQKPALWRSVCISFTKIL